MRQCLRALIFTSAFVALAGPAAATVTIDWVLVGNANNAADVAANCFTNDCGSVPYEYMISKYEITNSQYAEFLNHKAASDSLGLYNPGMGTDGINGGILRSGVAGSFVYTVKTGFESKPVGYLAFYDALRFTNWLNNGQGTSDTESGAYTLLGGTPTPSDGNAVTRNSGARIVLTSENEWYKAAYYDAVTASFLAFPAATNAQTTCSGPTAAPNRANCGNAVGRLTDVGSYPGSASPYGTFDQGGNAFEWNEQYIRVGAQRGLRGGAFYNSPSALWASYPFSNQATNEFGHLGFRVAMIPEPGTGLLVATGMLGLAVCSDRRRPIRSARNGADQPWVRLLATKYRTAPGSHGAGNRGRSRR